MGRLLTSLSNTLQADESERSLHFRHSVLDAVPFIFWRVHTSLLSDVFDAMLFINNNQRKMFIALVIRFNLSDFSIKRIASRYKGSLSSTGKHSVNVYSESLRRNHTKIDLK